MFTFFQFSAQDQGLLQAVGRALEIEQEADVKLGDVDDGGNLVPLPEVQHWRAEEQSLGAGNFGF